MNRFFTYTLVLFAYTVSLGNCSPPYGANIGYGSAPPVQQVALSSLPNIEQYLNGASSYNAPAPSYSAPVYAPATAVVPSTVSAPSYSVGSLKNAVGSAPGLAYNAGPAASYNAVNANANIAPTLNAPSYTIQPTYSQTIYPGQQNYKALAAPSTYGPVSLPIIASSPVAKLYVPNNSYGSGISY